MYLAVLTSKHGNFPRIFLNLICYETWVEQLYEAYDIQLLKMQTSLFQPMLTTPCSPGICQQSDVGTSQVTYELFLFTFFVFKTENNELIHIRLNDEGIMLPDCHSQ